MFELTWAKNGTPNTLTGTGDTLIISDLTATKFNILLGHVISSSTDINRLSRFSSNTGNNYANRYSSNGGADSTSTSGDTMFTNSTGPQYNEFGIAYFIDISGEEKLLISHAVGDSASTGAGTAPDRRETVSKFSVTTNITAVNGLNSDVGDYIADTNMSLLGTD